MKHFTEFCSSCNILDPFLLTEPTLCFYVSFLAEKGLAPPDHEGIPGGSAECADLNGLPRPSRQIVSPTVEEGTSWNQ